MTVSNDAVAPPQKPGRIYEGVAIFRMPEFHKYIGAIVNT